MEEVKNDYKDGNRPERIFQVEIQNNSVSKKHGGGNKTKVRNDKVENIDDIENPQLPNFAMGTKKCDSDYKEGSATRNEELAVKIKIGVGEMQETCKKTKAYTGCKDTVLEMHQEIQKMFNGESNVSNIEENKQIITHKREDLTALNRERTKVEEDQQSSIVKRDSSIKTIISVEETLRRCKETIAVMQETVKRRTHALASMHMESLKLIHDEENDPFEREKKARQLNIFNKVHEERRMFKRESNERIKKQKETQQARLQDRNKKRERREWFLQGSNGTITRVEKGVKITQGLLAVAAETIREASVKRKNAARQVRKRNREEKEQLKKVKAELFPQVIQNFPSKTQKSMSGFERRGEPFQLPLARNEDVRKESRQLRRQKDAKRERLAFFREMREELKARELAEAEANHISPVAKPKQQTTTEEEEEAEKSEKTVKEAWDDSSDEGTDEDDDDLTPNQCSEAGTSLQFTSKNRKIVPTKAKKF